MIQSVAAPAARKVPANWVLCRACGASMPPNKRTCACGVDNPIAALPAAAVPRGDASVAPQTPSPVKLDTPIADVIEHPAQPTSWVVIEKYHGQIDGVTIQVPAGHVVRDPNTAARFASGGAVIVPADKAPGMTCCPQCHHIFAVPTARPAGAKRAG